MAVMAKSGCILVGYGTLLPQYISLYAATALGEGEEEETAALVSNEYEEVER